MEEGRKIRPTSNLSQALVYPIKSIFETEREIDLSIVTSWKVRITLYRGQEDQDQNDLFFLGERLYGRRFFAGRRSFSRREKGMKSGLCLVRFVLYTKGPDPSDSLPSKRAHIRHLSQVCDVRSHTASATARGTSRTYDRRVLVRRRTLV